MFPSSDDPQADGPALLPPDAPLAMPVQRFDRAPATRHAVTTSPPEMLARRLLLLALTLLFTLAASTEVRIALLRDGTDSWDLLLLVLFFPLFAWISFGFINSAVGFALVTAGAHPGFVPVPRPPGAPGGRTAVLVPIHNEDVDAVFGRIRIMAHSLARAGGADSFDIFVLSDSGAAAEPAEQAARARIADGLPLPIFYRRRTENVARKPGNIADWVRRFGAAYPYMLVLDADSLMSGGAMVGMASIMDQRPGIGLLQTVPTIIAGQTLFQRWMQFASRLYGPIASAGLGWWSGAEATFWGHNAIIRTAAFAESCGLPELPGRAPFGGAIMSHDMVEAALLRRRGWAVHMIMVDGSHEEYPPTSVDHAVRDRRWAQGNLQHLGLLSSAGFHWVSRMQLLIGASAYVTSPAWLLLMLVTLGGFLGHAGRADSAPPLLVLGFTIVLLFGPKAMAVAWALSSREQRAGFGGTGALLRSVALDLPLSMLMAPMSMLTQTMDLVGIIAGRKSGWHPQTRDRDGLAFADVWPRYRWHVALGLAFLALTPVMPLAAAWLSPVTFGLLASPWFAMVTARRALGRRLAIAGLFCVPESPIEIGEQPIPPIQLARAM